MDVGDTFWTMKFENGVRRRSHFNIILCYVEEAGERFGVTVNVTSNSGGDTTTILTPDEHPDLSAPQSFVYYNKAQKRPLNEGQLKKAEESGLFVRGEKLSFGLLVRILEGAVKSPRSPSWLPEAAEAELQRITF